MRVLTALLAESHDLIIQVRILLFSSTSGHRQGKLTNVPPKAIVIHSPEIPSTSPTSSTSVNSGKP